MRAYKMTMVHRLKLYRTENDLDLAEFAAMVGVSSSLISRIENGRVQIMPVVATAIEMATRGQVTRHELRPDLWPNKEAAE